MFSIVLNFLVQHYRQYSPYVMYIWKSKPVIFLQNFWWDILEHGWHFISPFCMKTYIYIYSFIRKKETSWIMAQLWSSGRGPFWCSFTIYYKISHFTLDLWSVWSRNNSVCLRVSFQHLWLFAQFQSKQDFYYQVVPFCPFDVVVVC